MAEASDTRFLNTCRRLLDIFTGDAKWNPSNGLLDLGKLEAKLAAGYPIAQDVFAKVAPQIIRINERQASYAKVAPMVRASRRYLKSSGATELEVADANTIINKILGVRSTPKPKIDPNQPAGTVKAAVSVSHLSFDSRLGNITDLREYYANVTAYKPNETDIKVTGFDALIAELQTANNAVSTGFVPILTALNLRDAELYDNPNSILETFRDAKDYYKSLYLPSSPQYKSVTAKSMALESNSRK